MTTERKRKSEKKKPKKVSSDELGRIFAKALKNFEFSENVMEFIVEYNKSRPVFEEAVKNLETIAADELVAWIDVPHLTPIMQVALAKALTDRMKRMWDIMFPPEALHRRLKKGS
jgi:hypothetical protein